MDKIILVDGRFEDVALLKACFRVLFPECEIQTVTAGKESLWEKRAVSLDPVKSKEILAGN
jgi:hypothetical protein